MDVGVNTVPLASEPLEDALAYLDSLGVDVIELACGGVHSDRHLRRADYLDDEEAQSSFHALLDRYGMTLSAISTHNNPLHPIEARAEQADIEVREAIELAGQLGVETVVCFSGLPAGSDAGEVPNWITASWPSEHLDALDYQWDVAIEYWQEVAAIAAAHEVRVAIEMHPNMLVYEPTSLLRLREATNQYIGANVDPSHLYWQGISIPDAIRLLGDHDAIHFFHAKDTKVHDEQVRVKGVLDTTPYADERNRSWLFRTLGYGHGEEHWRDIVSALRMVGYDGTLSVEHEDSLASAREGLEKSYDLLSRIVFEAQPDEAHWVD